MMALLRNLALALTLAVLPGAVTLGLTATPVAAQQSPSAPDYDRWDALAQRASNAVENRTASTSAFESLRDQLAEWRRVFSGAQDINANAIATLEAQLSTLGPAPEGDNTEAPEIASQRKDLNDQLATLRAPVKEAKLAYSRADETIKSIDGIIRDRQTEAFLKRGPSPLNPQTWPAGLDALGSTLNGLRSEIATDLISKAQHGGLWSTLPITILLVLLGVLLFVRGRFWTELLVRIVMPQAATSGRWLVSFLISLGEIIVPFIGLLIVIKAFSISGISGARGSDMLEVLRTTVLIFLVARWLAKRCFPRYDHDRRPLDLEPEERRSGRRYGAAMGVIIAVFHFIHQISTANSWPAEARVVVLFPVMVLAGLLLIRLARLLSQHTRTSDETAEEDSDEHTYRSKLTRILSRLLMAVALLAPVLAAIGYNKAAVGILMPSLLSLMLLAALLVMKGLITEIYILAARNREGAADELVPMLLGFLLVLASVPVFALIWGARVATLSELWVSFRRGITVGDTTISPSIFLTLAVVFAIGVIVTRVLQGTLRTSLLPKTKIDTGGRDAIVSGVGYIGIFLAALIAVTSAGIDLSSLAIVAGALSVGIGFGLQNIVSNFVSGIILLVERPISPGDWIEVNGQHGSVREISVRSTRIETFDRFDLIVPNADLVSGTVTNYTRGSTVGRVIIKVGVAFGTDTRLVDDLLREIARAHPMVLMNPEPTIIFMGIGNESFDFEIRAILRDVNFILNVMSDMNHEIAARFAKEGIEMPHQQRDIWLRNPETLTDAMGASRRTTQPREGADVAQTQSPSDDEAQRVEDPGDSGEVGADGDGGDGR